MARTTCLIEFDSPQNVYFGGQRMSGRVTLTLHKEKTVRGISIRIDGRAYCRWTEGSGDSKKTYIGEEYYLSERTYFLGDRNGEIELQPGVYSYTFQCHLPPGLPTSVEGDHGYIRYSATVNLDRPMWPDQEFEEGFTVIKPLNLNDMPHLKCPLEEERRKTFSVCCLFCCCQSSPLFIVCRMPVTGFTPGDEIALDIRVKNDSDTAVDGFHIKILKHIKFRPSMSSSKTKHDVLTVGEKRISRRCNVGTEETFLVRLEVPPIPPTDTTTSNICSVEYTVNITGHVSVCHTDPELKLPITIGTVPFMNAIGFQPQPAPLAPYPGQPCPTIPSTILMPMPQTGLPYPPVKPIDASTPYAPSTQAQPPSAPYIPYDPRASYTDCDPPTYQQAIRGQVDIQGKMFAPFYPVFRRNQSTDSKSDDPVKDEKK